MDGILNKNNGIPNSIKRPNTTSALPAMTNGRLPVVSSPIAQQTNNISSSASVESFTSLLTNNSRPKRNPNNNASTNGKPVRSVVELNKHIEETQAKMFQESQKLPTIMREVQKIYDQAHSTIELQLHHRRDIANKLNVCNQQFVNIFEQMLEEVMKMQRIKFKAHVALIEELRDEIINFENFIALQQEKMDALANEKMSLRRECDDEKRNVEKIQAELLRLNNHIKHVESEKILFPMAGRVGANALSELEMKNKMSKMKQEFKIQTDYMEQQFHHELHQLQRLNQELTKQVQEQQVTIDVLRKESSVFSHIDKVQMKRPSKDSSCQTEVNEDDGLWDRQDGWILPISSFIVARSRWRQALNFTTCPACRGVGKYIAQVAVELKRARMGVVDVLPGLDDSNNNSNKVISPSNSTQNDSSHDLNNNNNVAIRKWILPDELTLFLSNLPRSVQAINPFSLQWTIKRVYLIIDGKLKADREDFRMGFRPQSLVEYCIEIFLRNAPSRAKAEINLYVFVKSLREHYQQSPLLKLFTKLFGVSDSSTKEKNNRATMINNSNYTNNASSNGTNTNNNTSTSNTNTVKRKTKIENPYKDLDFLTEEHALSKEILAIVLFARDCLFVEPYNGVYKQTFQTLRQVRRVGEHFEKGLFKTAQKMFVRTQITKRDTTGYHDTSTLHTHHHLTTTAGEKEKNMHPLPTHVFVDAYTPTNTNNSNTSSTTMKTLGNNGHNASYCAFYIPLDRAIHVLLPFMQHLSHNEVMSILHAVEDHTRILQYNNQVYFEGKIFNPEGQRSFVRSVVRLFAFAENETARDIDDWNILTNSYDYRIGEDRHNSNNSNAKKNNNNSSTMEEKNKEEKETAAATTANSHNRRSTKINTSQNSKNPKNDNNNTETGNTSPTTTEAFRLPPEALQHVLVIDSDYILLIIAEISRRKLLTVEQQLKRIFEEGDVNHDNVLSFEEFSEIVCKVDAECPDRKILRMFREALILGGDKDVIGPQQYLTVCKDFNLIRLVDVEALARGSLSSLCRNSSFLYNQQPHNLYSQSPRSATNASFSPHHNVPQHHHTGHNIASITNQHQNGPSSHHNSFDINNIHPALSRAVSRVPHGSFNHHVFAANEPSYSDTNSSLSTYNANVIANLMQVQNTAHLYQYNTSGNITTNVPGGLLPIDDGMSVNGSVLGSAGSISSQHSKSNNQALLELMKTGKKLPVNSTLSKEMAEQMKLALHQRKTHRLEELNPMNNLTLSSALNNHNHLTMNYNNLEPLQQYSPAHHRSPAKTLSQSSSSGNNSNSFILGLQLHVETSPLKSSFYKKKTTADHHSLPTVHYLPEDPESVSPLNNNYNQVSQIPLEENNNLDKNSPILEESLSTYHNSAESSVVVSPLHNDESALSQQQIPLSADPE